MYPRVPLMTSFAMTFLASVAALAHEPTLFHFVGKPGPYSVGLKVIEQYDYSRKYGYQTDAFGKPREGESARPMQTLIWYPTLPSTSSPMTVGDYAALWGTETNFVKPELPVAALEELEGMRATLAMRLWAVRNEPPAPGPFPVVIYSPGLSPIPTPWENADLCEYLASYGYVVAAAPNIGTLNQHTTLDLAGIDSQARDISFLISYMRALPNTDGAQVAVVGFSWGGIANLFAASRDNRITALVALDGSMRYFPGLVKQAGDVHPEQMAIPLLYFKEGNFSLEDEDRLLSDNQSHGPSVLNEWTHGDLTSIQMLALTHLEFSAMAQRNEDTWKEFYNTSMPGHQNGDYDRDDGIVGYGWVARYALAFLDANLKGDRGALAFLNAPPTKNGVPKHFMSVEFRAATNTVSSFDRFRTQVGREGFDHATSIYAAMQRSNSNFSLASSDLIVWAEELMDNNYLPDAISILKLNVQIHGDFSSAYATLGDAYKMSGQIQLALECYQSSLEQDPVHQKARIKLDNLRRGASVPREVPPYHNNCRSSGDK